MVTALESAGAYSPRTLLTTISATPARHKTAILMSWWNLELSYFLLSFFHYNALTPSKIQPQFGGTYQRRGANQIHNK
jgi:hypothetical protein